MLLQNWWYTTLLNIKADAKAPLTGDENTDYLIIGGGIAGIHAAQYLAEMNLKVMLLEKNILGGGTTGKSAGFLTPDSELELYQLQQRYGSENAKKLWDFPSKGIEKIVQNIKKYNIECDLVEQDSLFLGIGKNGEKAVTEEAETREQMNFEYEIFNNEKLKSHNTGKNYTKGLRYPNTYGINPIMYAQGMKNVLLSLGVRIHESTEVLKIWNNTAYTHLAKVKAKKIIVCIDKMPLAFDKIANRTHSAQTFLSITEPLREDEIKQIFPSKHYMCWDSKLVYSYYRLTGDNRLLLGGGEAISTFLPFDFTSSLIIQNVIKDFQKNFPVAKKISFIQYWPGRIDTTKDIMPIIEERGDDCIYIQGCVGLPWAAACGEYAAQKILSNRNDLDEFFKYDRKFFLPFSFENSLFKMPIFALNNAYSKYLQKGY
jgi:gamma-glutamylputrescine oxidase